MNTPFAAELAIIGAGPAGLMAAEVASEHGLRVAVFDAMPSAGRKFLMAGVGGLNISHAELSASFIARYGARAEDLRQILEAFDAQAIRAWMSDLGVDSFVGSSGRIFPADMKAAPLLRAWLHRLRSRGVQLHMRHRWQGWDLAGALRFDTPQGPLLISPRASLFALGGGSWARLGSDGSWVPRFAERGIDVAPLRPANCGFELAWSAHFIERFAGAPLKPVALHYQDADAQLRERLGECLVSAYGLEGSLIYALSAPLREHIATHGHADIALDLMPQHTHARVLAEVSHPRGSRSLASHLQSRLGLKGVKVGLLNEVLPAAARQDPAAIANALKALPLRLRAPRSLDEAISSAGGVRFEGLDSSLMLKTQAGTFCAGEMLDWEAPTGGYLLSACLATGRWAAHGALRWLKHA